MVVNPLHRLSEHFVLADFLGNHSVYTKGIKNTLEGTAAEVEIKLANATALCNEILEPTLERYGPLSIGYGYISSQASQAIVTYQSPHKPSHHRWDLGAGADICVHRWVQGLYGFPDYDPEQGVACSPIWLGHMIDQAGMPYSRLITYSESPFLCLACSAKECEQGKPRRAFYENRYEGREKAKPVYRTLSNERARRAHFEALGTEGLPAPWQGRGYPTYHGGGREQYQHQRVSKYTMLSDWLLDLQSIAKGQKNIPALNLDSVQDAIGAAGLIYDQLIDGLGVSRFSILAGYVSHTNPEFNPNNDWRSGRIAFKLLPANEDQLAGMAEITSSLGVDAEVDNDGGLWIAANVETIYESAQKDIVAA